MAITRTPMIDDDGSGTTGTILNNAWKVELYDQIDAAILAGGGGVSLAASCLLGRGSAGGTGTPEAITLGTGLTMTGTTLSVVTNGTWTPILSSSSGPGSGQTYQRQVGSYSRIGPVVIFFGELWLSNKGTVPAIPQVGGLPLPIASAGAMSIANFSGFASSIYSLFGSVDPAYPDRVGIGILKAAGTASGSLALTDLANDWYVKFSGIYLTSAP